MSARRVRRTTSIALFALLGAVAFPLLASQSASGADWHEGACVGDSGVTVVVDATTAGAGTQRAVRTRPAGQRLGSPATRAPHGCTDSDLRGRRLPDRRSPGGGVSHLLGDELLELPPRAETRGRARTGRSVRPARRRTSPPPAASKAGSTRAPRRNGSHPVSGRCSRKPRRRRHRRLHRRRRRPRRRVQRFRPNPAPDRRLPRFRRRAASRPARARRRRSEPRRSTARRRRFRPRCSQHPARPRRRRAPRRAPTTRELAGRALGGVDLSSKTHASSGFPVAMLVGIALIVAFAASAGVVAYRRRTVP